MFKPLLTTENVQKLILDPIVGIILDVLYHKSIGTQKNGLLV